MISGSGGISKSDAIELTQAMKNINMKRHVKMGKLGNIKISLNLGGQLKEFTISQLNKMRNQLMESHSGEDFAKAFDTAQTELSTKILGSSKRANIRNKFNESKIGKLFQRSTKKELTPASERIVFGENKPKQFDFSALQPPYFTIEFESFKQALAADPDQMLALLDHDLQEIAAKENHLNELPKEELEALTSQVSELKHKMNLCNQKINGSPVSPDNRIIELQQKLKAAIDKLSSQSPVDSLDAPSHNHLTEQRETAKGKLLELHAKLEEWKFKQLDAAINALDLSKTDRDESEKQVYEADANIKDLEKEIKVLELKIQELNVKIGE